MDSVLAGRPLIDYIKLAYSANRPPLIIGAHGVGKSELIAQAAEEMNIQFIVRDLSLMEPPDLVGLPIQEHERTCYAPPKFLPTSGSGLLVFEELNRCERYMRSPCLQLLTARQLNDYRLPPGWLPVAAINPPGEDYEVAALDPALLSRFVQVQVNADREEWLKWAEDHGVHDVVIKYVRSDMSVFDDPASSPRSWKFVSDVLIASERDGHGISVTRTAVLGLVGDCRGVAFLKTYTTGTEAPLTTDQVVNEYTRHSSEFRGWIKSGRIDLAQSTLVSIEKLLQSSGVYESVKNHRQSWQNLALFLHDLPPDLHEDAKRFFDERGYAFPRKRRRAKKAA